MRIVKEEGPQGLFRGAGPTVVRAMALNMGMLASNDQVHTPRATQGPSNSGSCPTISVQPYALKPITHTEKTGAA